jgi:hypothetical protein
VLPSFKRINKKKKEKGQSKAFFGAFFDRVAGPEKVCWTLSLFFFFLLAFFLFLNKKNFQMVESEKKKKKLILFFFFFIIFLVNKHYAKKFFL